MTRHPLHLLGGEIYGKEARVIGRRPRKAGRRKTSVSCLPSSLSQRLLESERERRKQILRLVLFTRRVSLCVTLRSKFSSAYSLFILHKLQSAFKLLHHLEHVPYLPKCGYTWRQSAFTVPLFFSKTANIQHAVPVISVKQLLMIPKFKFLSHLGHIRG